MENLSLKIARQIKPEGVPRLHPNGEDRCTMAPGEAHGPGTPPPFTDAMPREARHLRGREENHRLAPVQTPPR